jgi:sarcosine oxidase subunit gamma
VEHPGRPGACGSPTRGRLFGLAPPTPNTTARHAALTGLWLGPTSWLLVASDAPALTAFAAQRDAVHAAGGALFDVGASSLAWTVGGPHAVTVLAKQCPLDFHVRAFVRHLRAERADTSMRFSTGAISS